VTNVEEQNLRAGIRNLIAVAVQQTGDSRYYVARLVQDIALQVVREVEREKADSNV
jgi:hypothetical protein